MAKVFFWKDAEKDYKKLDGMLKRFPKISTKLTLHKEVRNTSIENCFCPLDYLIIEKNSLFAFSHFN